MKRKLLSLFIILCMILSLNVTMAPMVFAGGGSSNSYFLITKSAPSDSDIPTNYYYVYAGTSETSLSAFQGAHADVDSNTAYSVVDKAITDIDGVVDSSATLYFAATGNSLATASGTLDNVGGQMTLDSGTYTIKGAINNTLQQGFEAIHLNGASVIIDGATIESSFYGISNTGSGSITVNSGTITSVYNTILITGSGSFTLNGGTMTSTSDRTATISSNRGTGDITVNSGTITFAGIGIYATNCDGNVTVNGGTISGSDKAIHSQSGTGDITVNSGTITAEGTGVYAINCDGNVTVNGGTISSTSSSNHAEKGAIFYTGTGSLSITGGEMSSLANKAVYYNSSGSLIISGNLWDNTAHTGTLLSSTNERLEDAALHIGQGAKNAEIKGGTLLAASTAVYVGSDVTISGGLVKSSSNYPALLNLDSTVTITDGTITSTNSNTSVDISNENNPKIPGTIALAGMNNTAKLYISGGAITNTAATGYAISNVSLIPEKDSYVYLSGTPVITGKTADISSYKNIFANDGGSTYYTGSPVKLYYSDTITAGTTVAVSNVSSAVNSSLFSLTNDGYGLYLSGAALIIKQAPTGLTGVAPTSSGGTDGKINGTTASMEYKLFSAADIAYTACSEGSTTVGAAGDYSVRFAADGTNLASAPVTVTVPANTSSNSSLSSILSQTIVAGSGAGTASDPKTAAISVANSVSSITAADIAGATDSTVIFYGIDSTFTTAAIGSVALTAGSSTTVYIKVTAQDGETVNYYAVGITRAAATSSSSSSRSHSSSNSQSSSSSGTDVLVNGVAQSAGSENTETVDGKTKTTINVNEDVLSQKIAETIANKGTDGTEQNTVEVVVSDTDSDQSIVQLNGAIINKMEDNSFDLNVTKGDVSYSIPAKEFTIDAVAEQMGVSKDDLADIEVEVAIGEPSDKALAAYETAAKAMGNQLLIPPVSFTITAHTTNSDGTERTNEIDTFSSYVERTVRIPDGVDPSTITTGIVFNPDGTYSHVPTDVFQKDGKWYAKLNSLTNSDYSVIWNPITVKSVENHWAKDAVNDMASRLIIFNPESFEPNKAITRADFAEYIVRALGLYREGSTHENKFKDVSATGERTLAILIANEYGIVSGYEDSSFRGDNPITREEAMTMYQRAMKITKLTGNDENRISTYSDSAQVSKWAVPSVTDVLSANVFNGTTATTISPKANLTYAESAQAIKNLLVKSKLINK